MSDDTGHTYRLHTILICVRKSIVHEIMSSPYMISVDRLHFIDCRTVHTSAAGCAYICS